jgi:hypothetical protein
VGNKKEHPPKNKPPNIKKYTQINRGNIFFLWFENLSLRVIYQGRTLINNNFPINQTLLTISIYKFVKIPGKSMNQEVILSMADTARMLELTSERCDYLKELEKSRIALKVR